MQRPSDRAPQGVDFVWLEAERRLEAQMRQADSLDTKAGVLVAVHAVAAGVVGAIARYLIGSARVVGVIVVVGLLASGWFAVQAFRAQQYDRSPSPDQMWRFGDWDGRFIRYRMLGTRFRAIEENRRRLRWKARWVTWSIFTLALVALVVGVSTVVSLIR